MFPISKCSVMILWIFESSSQGFARNRLESLWFLDVFMRSSRVGFLGFFPCSGFLGFSLKRLQFQWLCYFQAFPLDPLDF